MKLYCKVFLDTSLSKPALLALLATWTGGQVQLRTISAPTCEIDVVANEDFDEDRRNRIEDGFLYYRFYLDIEPRPDVNEMDYIQAIQSLVLKARTGGIRAVAACDFEDQLALAID